MRGLQALSPLFPAAVWIFIGLLTSMAFTSTWRAEISETFAFLGERPRFLAFGVVVALAWPYYLVELLWPEGLE